MKLLFPPGGLCTLTEVFSGAMKINIWPKNFLYLFLQHQLCRSHLHIHSQFFHYPNWSCFDLLEHDEPYILLNKIQFTKNYLHWSLSWRVSICIITCGISILLLSTTSTILISAIRIWPLIIFLIITTDDIVATSTIRLRLSNMGFSSSLFLLLRFWVPTEWKVTFSSWKSD